MTPKKQPREKSRSDAQLGAEKPILVAASSKLRCALAPRKLRLSSCVVEIDGYFQCDDRKRIVLVECWARVGAAKGAQIKKVLTDVLKLAFVASELATTYRGYKIGKYIACIDEEAQRVIANQGWGTAAARKFGVQPILVEIDELVRVGVLAAQEAQDLSTS